MPPLVIDATPGGAAANSYRASEPFAAFVAGVGGVYSDAAQASALVSATREIDALPFKGRIATDTQALRWPRADVPDPDRPGGTLDPLAIPRAVEGATEELALAILAGANLRGTTSTTAYKSVKVGTLAVEYRDEAAASVTYTLERYPGVWLRLLPLLALGTPAPSPDAYRTVRSVRGPGA